MKIVQLNRGDCGYPITVAELKGVSRQLEKLLGEDEVNALVDFIAHNPESGVVMPNTNGIRKLRWNLRGKGKSRGMRVIYFFHDLNMPLFLLAVYSKGEKLRPTKREEKQMRDLVNSLKAEHRRKWEELIEATNSASCA
ncbi:MAG: addiction module toxin RelE [Pseudomonadota bacterium]